MSAIRTFTVTVSYIDGGNKYFLDGVQQDTINLAEGYTYVFNYPSAHPFRFSTTSDGTHNSGSEYTTGVTVNSSTQVTIVVADSAPQLYYYCSIHSGMGGAANTVDPDTWGVLQWNQNTWGSQDKKGKTQNVRNSVRIQRQNHQSPRKTRHAIRVGDSSIPCNGGAFSNS